MAWAALRWPNGAPLFFVLLMGFLLIHFVWPALRSVFQVPRRPTPPAVGVSAAASVALLLGGLILVNCASAGAAPRLDGSFPLTPALSPIAYHCAHYFIRFWP